MTDRPLKSIPCFGNGGYADSPFIPTIDPNPGSVVRAHGIRLRRGAGARDGGPRKRAAGCNLALSRNYRRVRFRVSMMSAAGWCRPRACRNRGSRCLGRSRSGHLEMASGRLSQPTGIRGEDRRGCGEIRRGSRPSAPPSQRSFCSGGALRRVPFHALLESRDGGRWFRLPSLPPR